MSELTQQNASVEPEDAADEEMQALEQTPETPTRLDITVETKADDLVQALEAYDKKNKADTRRNFHLMGVMVVLWMFVPNLMEDPTMLLSWIMVALAVALLVFVLKYPAYSNRKYAERRVVNSPKYILEITRDGVDVTEGGGHYYAAFSGGCAVYDYKGVYACCFEKNQVFAIPKSQMDEDTCESLCALFRQGLGDRFEKISDDRRSAFRAKAK